MGCLRCSGCARPGSIAVACGRIGCRGSDKVKNAEEFAQELANPNTSLGFMTFQLDYIAYDGDLPDADDQDAWRFNFQPSIPYPIAKRVNFFLRPLIPVILKQPVPESEGFEDYGVDLSDISFDAGVGKSFPSGLQLIGGMVGAILCIAVTLASKDATFIQARTDIYQHN